MKNIEQISPEGKRKLVQSFCTLMGQKDFHSITTLEVSTMAGVSEGLIYKYFKNKNDLLYQVLNLHFQSFHDYTLKKIELAATGIEKLTIVIHTALKTFAADRVFARILLLEVRNAPTYFESDAYQIIKNFDDTILELIRQAQINGELKRAVTPSALQQVIWGSIEHACMRELVFNDELDADRVSKQICNIIFQGAKR